MVLSTKEKHFQAAATSECRDTSEPMKVNEAIDHVIGDEPLGLDDDKESGMSEDLVCLNL